MSGSHLPDDLALWPRDPYRLLGIQRGASLQDSRRAYASLIRCFRPDEFPEQYQRVRSAFEQIEQRLKAASRNSTESDHCSPASAKQDRCVECRPRASSPPSSAESRPSLSAFDNEAELPRQTVQNIWRQHRNAGIQSLYNAFLDYRQHAPGDPEGYLRLYWLLRLAPTLDDPGLACGWLLEGLERTTGMDTLLRLYCLEMRTRPESAMLDSSNVLVPRLLALGQSAQWPFFSARWHAASRLGRSDLILADASRIQEMSHGNLTAAHGHLLVEAARLLTWDISAACQAAVREIVLRLDQLDLSLHGELAVLDQQMTLSQGYSRLMQLEGIDRRLLLRLPQLLMASMESSSNTARFHLLSFCEPLVAEASDWSHRQLQQISEAAPEVLQHVHRVLRAVILKDQPGNDAAAEFLMVWGVGQANDFLSDVFQLFFP